MRHVVLKTLDRPNRAEACEAFPVPSPSCVCIHGSGLGGGNAW